MKGGISGGTIDSFRNQVITAGTDADARRVLADPYALSPRRADEPTAHGPGDTGTARRPDRSWGVERDRRTGRWRGPFVMSDYNTRLVRLSNTLTGWSYGRTLAYREVTDFGAGRAAPLLAAGMSVGLRAFAAGMSTAPGRALLDRLLPRPGEGPSESRRKGGRFRMELTATTTTGARYGTTVAAGYDPGYGGTAIMLGQSALCLALDGPRPPSRSGVLTPATAMGDVLVERLRAHGFTFQVERLG
jgi:short subunit dehydrogenase-like uncharacterized protein